MNAERTFSVHTVVTILKEHKPKTHFQAIIIFSTSPNILRKMCYKCSCHNQHCVVAKHLAPEELRTSAHIKQ